MNLKENVGGNQKTLASLVTALIIAPIVRRKETAKLITKRGFARGSWRRTSDGAARVRHGSVFIPLGHLMP